MAGAGHAPFGRSLKAINPWVVGLKPSNPAFYRALDACLKSNLIVRPETLRFNFNAPSTAREPM